MFEEARLVRHATPEQRSALLASDAHEESHACFVGWHDRCKFPCGCRCHAVAAAVIERETAALVDEALRICPSCNRDHDAIDTEHPTVDPDLAMFGYDLSHLYPDA